ncbi:MAG: hypothetical protein PHE52_00950 [Candidatus Pacebacteria bacterium]|nr:hypothetical protein [Candidatus Paceibacterota bacterium]
MKRWIVLLIVLTFFQTFSLQAAEAAVNQTISIESQNVILANSDVELISLNEKGEIYAIVKQQTEYKLFRSEDKGNSWQRIAASGLPTKERFISLKTTAPNLVVLATTTRVFLSQDGGERFGALGGPQGISERGEAISSLAVSGGASPQILVGVWNPKPGKFAEEGVYLWGSGKASWEAQGMRQVWQGKSYNSDVTSVAFLDSNILALATGDPDAAGVLAEGTYLNIAYQGQKAVFGGLDWNWLPGWPVEISQTISQSPNESEIIDSKMVLSEFNGEEGYAYVVLNTRQKGTKDDVYRIELSSDNYLPEQVLKLGITRTEGKGSLDSIDYLSTKDFKILAVGTSDLQGTHLWYLTTPQARVFQFDWQGYLMRIADTVNCRVAIGQDGTLYAGTSGAASCFARSEKDNLIPVSLIDGSGKISNLTLSQNFTEDRSVYLAYGDRNILRLQLSENYQLQEISRVFYSSQKLAKYIKIDSGLNQNLYLAELGTKRLWRSPNGGLSWGKTEKEVEITDLEMVGSSVFIAGKDAMIYVESAGTPWSRLSSGLNWIQRIEPGPNGVIAVGGSKVNSVEALSLINETTYRLLPPLPSSAGIILAYSAKENTVFLAAGKQLYRWVVDSNAWEKTAEFTNQITNLLVSSQGLYVFRQSQVYFTPFPLGKDISWLVLGELKGSWLGCKVLEVGKRTDLLILWDSSRVFLYNHQIPEQKAEENVVPPVKTDQPKTETPKPVAAEISKPAEPKTTPTPTVKPAETPVVSQAVLPPPSPQVPPAPPPLPPAPETAAKGGFPTGVTIFLLILGFFFICFILFLLIRRRVRVQEGWV